MSSEKFKNFEGAVLPLFIKTRPVHKLADLRNGVALERAVIKSSMRSPMRSETGLQKLCGKRGRLATAQLAGAFIVRSKGKPNLEIHLRFAIKLIKFRGVTRAAL